MNKNEFQNIKTIDLIKKAKDKKIELFNLRFQNATGELTDTSQIKKTRKQIARILTEINARK